MHGAMIKTINSVLYITTFVWRFADCASQYIYFIIEPTWCTKFIVKQKYSASSWLITEINVTTCFRPLLCHPQFHSWFLKHNVGEIYGTFEIYGPFENLSLYFFLSVFWKPIVSLGLTWDGSKYVVLYNKYNIAQMDRCWYNFYSKHPEEYEDWRFITVVTRARHLSLPWARSIQFSPLKLSLVDSF